MICANTVQSHWILNVPGANLNCDHEIFTIMYMYLIFKELNSDLFEFEEIVCPGLDKTYDVDKMLPFTGWAHYHEVESCRGMEELWKHNIEASTIGSFLLEYEEMIKLFDDFIKKFGVNLGLIEGKTIYWDGTFLKANCNNHKKM